MNRFATEHTRLQDVAFYLSICFGLLLVFQVQVAGDGMWFWYGQAFNHGSLLYRDLHLTLQPSYPLITAFCLRVFGQSWIAGKIPAIVFLTLYSLGLRVLARHAPGRDSFKAITYLLGFGSALAFEASRFDDYHVVTDACSIYALVLLLRGTRGTLRASGDAWIAVSVGAVCGFATATRLNDGILLTLAVGVIIVRTGHHWLRRIVLFICSSVLILLTVIWTSRDSIRDWFTFSILRAVGAKGGSAHVVTAPLHLLSQTFASYRHNRGYLVTELALGSVAFLIYKRDRLSTKRGRIALVLSTAVLIASVKHWGFEEVPFAVFVLAVPASFLAAGLQLFKLMRRREPLEDPSAMLLLIPFSQLLSGSMSSSGNFLPLTSSLGVILVTWSVTGPVFLRSPRSRSIFGSVALVLAICCFCFKAAHPFRWYGYESPALFTNRVVYYHPLYGPMLIDPPLLSMSTKVCQIAAAAGGNSSLLSLPLPYENYFCGINPWHGYVQTFFDTSTAAQIASLLGDLRASPPTLIVYERRLKALEFHEVTFNEGKPLPHRELDGFLKSQIDHNYWTVLSQTCFARSDWLLISTKPISGSLKQPLQSAMSYPYTCD